jgi:hypothetical protein
MKLGRFIRSFLASLAAVLIVAGVCAGSTWLYLHPRIERVNGVAYGQREGRSLTLDVMRPAKANGLGVVMMVSGGWKSATAGCDRRERWRSSQPDAGHTRGSWAD